MNTKATTLLIATIALSLSIVHAQVNTHDGVFIGRWIAKNNKMGYTVTNKGINRFEVNNNRMDETGEDTYDFFNFIDTAIATKKTFKTWIIRKTTGYERTQPDSTGKVKQSFPETTEYRYCQITLIDQDTIKLTISAPFTFHDTKNHPVAQTQIENMKVKNAASSLNETLLVLRRFKLKG